MNWTRTKVYMKPPIEKKGSSSGSCADGFGVCCICKYTPKSLFIRDLKLRPCENSLADVCSSVLWSFHKINFGYSKKQTFKLSEVLKSVRDFSHDLNPKSLLIKLLPGL